MVLFYSQRIKHAHFTYFILLRILFLLSFICHYTCHSVTTRLDRSSVFIRCERSRLLLTFLFRGKQHNDYSEESFESDDKR